jgi:hypothetical protein
MLFEKLTQIVPKALLPISVLIIGFLIIAVSMLLTRLFMKIFNKIKDNKRK